MASLWCAAALVSGCTTVTPIDLGGTDPVAGWNAETRDIAGRSWLYAQLAINAYDDHEAFILPGDLVQRPAIGNDGIGYAYAIFDRFEGDRLAETIIVYRGTDPNLTEGAADVLFGAIGTQHGRGLATARAVHEQLKLAGLDDAELSVAGHSLGGSIAHHVTEHPLDDDSRYVARSVVFNTAPRIAGLSNAAPERIALVERGDWAGVLRALGNAPADLHRSIDCQPGFAPFRDHSMRDLAECLTWIAAFDDPEARLSLAANPVVTQPAVQTGEATPLAANDTQPSGVPINPYVNDAALARAIDAELREAEGVSPHYGSRTGYRVEVNYNAAASSAAVRWVRNGIEVQALSGVLDCRETAFVECARAIIAPGRAHIAEQLRKAKAR